MADRVTKGAREAILAAGGTIQEPPCAKQAANKASSLRRIKRWKSSASSSPTRNFESALIFTLVMLVIYRLGVHVSVPGVNAEALARNLGKAGDLLNVVDLFSGGAFKKFSIFALGITPYITASIVLQLMGAVVPTLENLQKKEGEAGRQKINQWTRYLTVGLAFIQGFGVATMAQSLGPDVVIIPGFGFKFLCGFTLSVGSVFVMWIGEQITDRGIGNGISLLIFAGIVAGLPRGVGTIGHMLRDSSGQQGQRGASRACSSCCWWPCPRCSWRWCWWRTPTGGSPSTTPGGWTPPAWPASAVPTCPSKSTRPASCR